MPKFGPNLLDFKPIFAPKDLCIQNVYIGVYRPYFDPFSCISCCMPSVYSPFWPLQPAFHIFSPVYHVYNCRIAVYTAVYSRYTTLFWAFGHQNIPIPAMFLLRKPVRQLHNLTWGLTPTKRGYWALMAHLEMQGWNPNRLKRGVHARKIKQ